MNEELNSYTLTSFHPSRSSDPTHVGLIPDGARRWAEKNTVQLSEAYLLAMNKIAKYIEFLLSGATQAVSVYLSSLHNFRRSEDDIAAFCEAETVMCEEILPAVAEKHKAKVVVAGRLDILPPYFQRALEQLQTLTSSQSSTRIYLCVAYNPLEELIEAFEVTDHTEEFHRNLWVPEPLDLVIRTSGANLISNFLPLQSGYARLYVLEQLFNDTSLNGIKSVVEDFRKLDRKYGD